MIDAQFEQYRVLEQVTYATSARVDSLIDELTVAKGLLTDQQDLLVAAHHKLINLELERRNLFVCPVKSDDLMSHPSNQSYYIKSPEDMGIFHKDQGQLLLCIPGNSRSLRHSLGHRDIDGEVYNHLGFYISNLKSPTLITVCEGHFLPDLRTLSETKVNLTPDQTLSDDVDEPRLIHLLRSPEGYCLWEGTFINLDPNLKPTYPYKVFPDRVANYLVLPQLPARLQKETLRGQLIGS